MSGPTLNQDDGKQVFDVTVSGTDRHGQTRAFFEGTVTSAHKRGATAVGKQIQKALKRQGLSHNLNLKVQVKAQQERSEPRSR